MIYLDHAATSNPKPSSVVEAMTHFISVGAANPSRGSYPLANHAARIIFEARERVASFFGADESSQVVFTASITESLNLSVKGLLEPGDEVIVSSMEHNAMMRPLRELERAGVAVVVIPCDSETGVIRVEQIADAISPATKMVAINHGSNTFGSLQPIAEIGGLCRQHGLLFLVDTAQTAGCIQIEMAQANIDLLAFTGHKGLQGPMGIGGLIVNARVQAVGIKPLITGGTGSNSEREIQPEFLPDALESGTPNLPGIAGLNAGIRWLQERGMETVTQHKQQLITQLLTGLATIPGVRVYGPPQAMPRAGVISFRIQGMDNGEVDEMLAYDHEIYCRIGLHCSPASHQTMGTFPEGTLRLSVGAFTTFEEIQRTLGAISAIASNSLPG